jgi:hypothetical protein
MQNSAVGPAIIAALALLIGGLVLAGEARAQTYPPPVGSLATEAAAAAPGGTTDVDATVLDNDGNPVDGADVDFTIVSQPGDDAHWDNGELQTTETTDADGVATAVLYAGSTPGDIVVETASGAMTSQVTVAVAEDASNLPVTGGLPTDGSEGPEAWQIGLLIGVLAALAGTFVLVTNARGGRA